MDRKRSVYMAVGFGLLLVVVAALLVWGGRRQSRGIILPESQSDGSGTGEEGGESRLNTVAITPATVRPAISTLSRPVSYSRAQTVETIWSGGSGQTATQIYVSGAWTRLDTQLPDGSTRHTLAGSDGDGQPVAGVWYDDETAWTLLRGQSADQAARMLSYETVLELPAEDIAAADYREREGERCVYVETRPDGDGYVSRYWVSVDSGLLAAAECLEKDEVVYRFTAGAPETGMQPESLFLLPDGRTLAEAAGAE